MKYIKYFDEIQISDIAFVGGKNASLGEMIGKLTAKGIRIPQGFAITSQAYWYYLEHNQLIDKMKTVMSRLTADSDLSLLAKIAKDIRTMIEHGSIPSDLSQEIMQAYHVLSQHYHVDNCTVAVRSSATAEDLPNASFAGQQESFLHIFGEKQLLLSYQKCLASLFTDRAIIYRVEKGFDHFKVALSVGVQKMIRSDLAVSGVAFSLDTESGFADVITIEASYGLGEAIVQGLVTPDEFVVHKPTLLKGFRSIIKKRRGEKKRKMVYAHHSSTKITAVSLADQQVFCLTDDEIIELSRYVMTIENYYSTVNNHWTPMDIEWAKDGHDGLLYIIQARPETVSTGKKNTVFSTYVLKNDQKSTTIAIGLSVGQKIVSGVARVIVSTKDSAAVQPGDIIVTDMTNPDWVPLMKKAAGIVTNKGGRTCHAAIVSRELGIPAIIGTGNATKAIKNGAAITLDCSQGLQGYVYAGNIPFDVRDIALDSLTHKTSPSIMINIADPATVFKYACLPIDGVGLARIEFIIATMIKIHPMALVYPEIIASKSIKKKIVHMTCSYKNQKDFFVHTLAQGIGMIAAAFYPRPVTVRFSDFKTNEYRNLIGGTYFEPVEENPMIGFRGASRYYNARYQEAFALECQAIKVVREIMGFVNVQVMIPFVRTVEEAQKVLHEMQKNGLSKKDDFEIIMMCEVPSNVLLIDEFSKLFDGFSIGSNDLTQLILAVDRDSEMLAPLFNEQDAAVKKMISMAIEGAYRNKRPIGICGQAPSDNKEFIEFLIKNSINSLSLNIDSVINFMSGR